MADLNKRFVAMNRLAEAGFPDDVWPVAFVAGCNLRCPYCLNASIVEPREDVEFITFADVIKQLDEWGEDGVMLSGGEVCMPGASGVVEMAEQFIARGKKVGIATNGTYPLVINELLDKKLVSFIGMDCKFWPDMPNGKPDQFPVAREMLDKAMTLLGSKTPIDELLQEVPNRVMEVLVGVRFSLSLIHWWHESDPNAKSEIRTTLYPPLVGETDIIGMGQHIHPCSRWVLQQYRPNVMFDGQGNDVTSYPDAEVERLLGLARENCKAKVEMRWP